MAYDWSGLLGEIGACSARRASFPVDEDERMRRRHVFGTAMSSEARQHRFVAAGIARKFGTGTLSSREATIASILQAPRSSQQSVIALFGALCAGDKTEDDDELRKSADGGGGGASNQAAARAARPVSMRHVAKVRSKAETASRAAIAAGAQPVVIKVTSTVSSRASAAGLMKYLGTREIENENGEKEKVDIPIYDQDGFAITNRNERGAALVEWGTDFRDAYAVNALATLSITLADEFDDAALRDALNAAFISKPFLYSRHPGGTVSIFAVTDLPARKIAGALRHRERGEGSARAAEIAESDFVRRLAVAGASTEVRILGAAVSKKSGRYFLEKFLRTEEAVTTSEGDPIERRSSVKDTADGIWRAWSSHIRTVEPRNAFHVIFSARGGTDPEAMTRAVRDFLSEQIAGHRWITAHHTDTVHVHIHAIISARDDVGKALRLTRPELYEWRERFAAKAREQGIAMVTTRRAEVAATRPYSQAQAGAYERGKGDPRYMKRSDVANRVERKRAGVVDRASLTNGSLALAPKWRATASALKRAGAESSVIAAAERFAAVATARTQLAAARASGFVLLRLVVDQIVERETMALIIKAAIGAEAKQDDEAGPETRSVVRGLQARFLAHGLRVAVEAVGSLKHGAPSPWLQRRSDAGLGWSGARPIKPHADFKILMATIEQQKENSMPLSLEQFEERVSRANKSIDRLETMVDSSAERQAIEEMRKEISALFEEQRRDIQMQQERSIEETAGAGGTPPAERAQDRPPPAAIDPAIAAQQQAIAAGRASRAARKQAGASKTTQDEQRQQTLRQAEHERQRGNDRDGAER